MAEIVTQVSWSQRFASYKFIALVVAVAAFTDGFIYGMILPITPDLLRNRIRVPEDQVQIWTSTLLAIFGLGFLITPPFIGLYVDRSASKRTPFLVGLVAVAVSTILFFVATSLPLLLIGRALQAASCSFVFTSGLSLVSHTAPPGMKGTAIGFVSMGSSMGDLGGPLIGGFLYQAGGHNAMFALAMALVGVDVFLRVLVVEESPTDEHKPLLSERNAEDDVSTTRESDLLDPAAGPSGFIPSAQPTVGAATDEAPKLNTSWIATYSQAPLWAAFTGMTITATVRTAFASTLTLYLDRQFNWDTRTSGCVFFALFIPTFFAPLYGKLSDRYGPRIISTTAASILTVGLIGLAFATKPTPAVKAMFIILLVFVGFTLPVILNAQNLTFVYIADDMKARGLGNSSGQVFALGQVGWAVGMLLGPMLAGVLITRYGWQGLCFAFAILSFLSAIIMATFSRSPPKKDASD